MKPDTQKLYHRIRQIGFSRPEFGADAEAAMNLLLVQEEMGRDDPHLKSFVDEIVQFREDEIALDSFSEPPQWAEICQGKIHVATTQGGMEIRPDLFDENGNCLGHVTIGGATATGKSYFTARLASGAAPHAHTLVIDSTGTFSNIIAMQQSHTFIDCLSLRLNPYDCHGGLSPCVVDQTINHELCSAYGLIHSEYLLNEVTANIRKQGTTPNLPLILDILRGMTFKGSYRIAQYRDSLVLVNGNLLAATNEFFRCSEGMSIFDLLNSNTVLEVKGLLPQHRAFVIRVLFEKLSLLALSGQRLDKILLFCIDEAQVIALQRDFPEKVLALRHSGIILVANFQNFSQVPIEIRGNSTLLVSFQSPDKKDCDEFSNSAGLAQQQKDRLAKLETGQCVLSSQSSNWKQPILAEVVKLQTGKPDVEKMKKKAEHFLAGLNWKPLETNVRISEPSSSSTVPPSKMEQQEMALLHDILNQAHEFSRLKERYERAGIRSASAQQRILKKIESEGYVRQWSLAVGRGRPWTLLEPTEKAFGEFNVKWKKTRGVLPTRAATHLIEQKLRAIEGWSVIREGNLGNKQVDLLCLDSKQRTVTIEIAHSPNHEIHNALACLKHLEVRHHHVVCTSKQTQEKVINRFNENPNLTNCSRVSVTTLAKAMSKTWQP